MKAAVIHEFGPAEVLRIGRDGDVDPAGGVRVGL